jgi:anti-anti-sigma factor
MSTDPQRVDVRVEVNDGVTIVRPSGEIDLANADDFSAALGSAETDGIVLDLREVTFLDSSGLRVILMASQDYGTRFATVIAEGSAVHRLLDVVDVASRVRLAASVEDAVARVDGAPVDGA